LNASTHVRATGAFLMAGLLLTGIALLAAPTPASPTRATAAPQDNTLSDAEKNEGFTLLFDGKTTDGWHVFKKKGPVSGWKVVDGALTRVAEDGDLITDQEFG